jgi:hypothetical protein
LIKFFEWIGDIIFDVIKIVEVLNLVQGLNRRMKDTKGFCHVG